MTDLQTAAQQALEALLTYEQYIQPLTNVFGGPRVPEEGSASAKVDAAITALKAALAEPVQERKPLTDDEVVALFNRLCKERAGYPDRRYRDFARWVEAAHGIGKKP